MDSTISVLPDLAWETTLEGGRRIAIRPCGPEDLPAVQAFTASPGAHYLSRPGNCPCRHGEVTGASGASLTYGAFTPEGLVLGAAWLQDREEDEAQLAVAVHSALRQTALATGLVAAIGREARARNVRRLRACVDCDSHDPLSEFRAAGARVSSSICLGGVTDVVLDLE